jgi:hypothetical protein
VEHDTDGNGVVDRIIHYESPGQIAQVWENLDPAGNPRTRLIYEAGKLLRGEFDTTGNGQVNQWLFYDTDGQVIRAEYDQHAKGRPDQWEYFTPGSREPYKVDEIPMGTARQTRCGRKVHQHRRNRAEGRRRHLDTAVGPDYRLVGTCLPEVISS